MMALQSLIEFPLENLSHVLHIIINGVMESCVDTEKYLKLLLAPI